MSKTPDITSEREIYVRLGRLLLQAATEYHPHWSEVLLHVDHVMISGAPEAFRIQLTVVLLDGAKEAMAPPPSIMNVSQELSALCQQQSGKRWVAYDYRLYQTERGPGFECSYEYGPPAH